METAPRTKLLPVTNTRMMLMGYIKHQSMITTVVL